MQLLDNKFAWLWVMLILLSPAAVVFTGTYLYFKKKAARIPVAFSEVSEVKRKYPDSPLSEFYASCHDVYMKVFESYNYAVNVTGNYTHRRLAAELETRVEETLKHHKLISEYSQEMDSITRTALKELEPLKHINERISSLEQSLNQVWDYSSWDNYNDCYTDSTGTHCDYSDTDHYFTYEASKARIAFRKFQEFYSEVPDFKIFDRVRHVNHVGAENLYGMHYSKSMKEDHEADSLADLWATGNVFSVHYPKIYAYYWGYKDSGDLIVPYKVNKNYHYNTSSRSHSGPEAYQQWEKLHNAVTYMHERSALIYHGAVEMHNHIVQLDDQIREYVDAVYNKDVSRSKRRELRKKLIKSCQEMYSKQFPNSLDVKPFKVDIILLSTVLTLLITCAVFYTVTKQY